MNKKALKPKIGKEANAKNKIQSNAMKVGITMNERSRLATWWTVDIVCLCAFQFYWWKNSVQQFSCFFPSFLLS